MRNFGVDKARRRQRCGSRRRAPSTTRWCAPTRRPTPCCGAPSGQLVYGAQHPLALDSGGYPDAIRTMTPEDIRTFHDATYHLANMGMIGAFPSSMSLASVLDHTARDPRQGGRPRRGKVIERGRPAEAGGRRRPGRSEVVDYPYGDTTNPGPMMLAWPATRELDATERTLLELFLDAFAGDESTHALQEADRQQDARDRSRRERRVASASDRSGPAGATLGSSGVKADKLDDETIGDVRALVIAELDADREAARRRSRARRVRRARRRRASSICGAGSRSSSTRRRASAFAAPARRGCDHLHQLEQASGLQEVADAAARARRDRADPRRRRRIRGASGCSAWGLLDDAVRRRGAAEPGAARAARRRAQRSGSTPSSRGCRSSTAPRTRRRRSRATRRDYDAADASSSRTSAKARRAAAAGRDAADDARRRPRVRRPARSRGVPAFRATFDSMASARVQLAFRLDAVARGRPDVPRRVARR